MILAIDIGLKNLAMCLMSCADKTNFKTYKIHLWDVFNILETDKIRECDILQKNGKVCNKKCNYKYINNETNNIVYCCKIHFPKTIKINKTHKVVEKKMKDYLLQDIAKCVVINLQSIYDENPIFKEITSIIIELQPKINPKMKFTSHIVYGKLVELYKDTDTTIRFVRASTKLRAYTGPPVECKLKGEYAKRKWLSVEYCKWILNNEFNEEEKQKWQPLFESFKKKDDASDVSLFCINALRGIPKIQHKSKKTRIKKFK